MTSTTLGGILGYLRRVSAAQAVRDLTDGELLQRFLGQREEAAFTILLQRHGPMVLGVCQRVLGDIHAAEDSFQATFLVLVRRAASVDTHEPLGNWLYTVARRIALRARAQTATRRHHEKRTGDRPCAEPLDDLAGQELRRVLDEEIGRLPQKYRVPLVLCYFDGRSYGQAAQELGWSKSSLAKRLTRARELLRGQLAQRGISLASGTLAMILGQQATATPVTALLTMDTVKAAGLVTGQAVTAGSLPARAATLAEETMKPVLGLKGKLVLALVALGLAIGGASLATFVPLPEKSQQPQVAETPPSPAKGAVNGQAKKEPLQARDRFGDLLLDGAVGRLGTVRFRGGVRTSGLVFAPDGKVLASTVVAGFGVCLWDAATGKPLHRLDVPFMCSQPPAFSPEGKTLIVAGQFRGQGNRIYHIAVATGEILRRIDGPVGTSLDTVAFSPDGRTVAAGESGGVGPSVVLWDVVTGKEVRRLEGHTEPIQSVAFSPDGKLLVSGSDDKTIRFWDVATGKELRRLPKQEKAIVAVAFAPGGKMLASLAQDEVLRLWEVATAKELQRLQTAEGSLRTFAFASDGKLLATGGIGGVVRLWDPASGKELRSWRAASRNLSGVAFAPGSKVLATAGSWEHAIRLWDTDTGKELHPRAGHTGTVEWLRFAPDGQALFSGGFDSQVLQWEPSTGQQRRQLVGGPLTPAEAKLNSAVTSTLSSDNKILARTNKYPGDGIIRLWDMVSRKELHTLDGHDKAIMWLHISPDARLLAAEGWGGTRVWDVVTGKGLYHKPGNAGASFSPDGRWLAGGGLSDKTIHLWEAATGKEMRRWPSQQEETWRILFSPDSKFLVSSGVSRSGVNLWEVETGKQVLSLTVPGYIDVLAFSPRGRLLAAVVRSGRTLRNGDVMETSTMYLWEVLSGQEIGRRDVVQGTVWSLAFAPDGRTLASGASDATILLWDLTGRTKAGQGNLAAPTAAELEALWSALAGDASKADRAGWALVWTPKQSVPFLQKRLGPVAQVDGKQIAGYLADLADTHFAVRQKAARALETMAEAAEAALRKTLASATNLEVRRRLEQILGKRNQEALRQLRALEVLEHLGTPEARQLLEQQAKSALNPRVAQAAGAAVQRLVKRSAALP